MKKLLLTLLSVALFSTAFSQTVETIRKDYSEAMEHAKLMNDPEYPPTNRFQVTCEQMMPGSGPHKVSYTFYYHEGYDEEDEEPNINGYLDRSIWYVKHSYNWAARDFYEEYLYDDKGNIEFIYARAVDDDDFSLIFEYRFYFNAKGVIKVIVKRKKEGESTFTQEYSGATVTSKYQKAYDQYKRTSEGMKTLFKTVDGYAD